MKLAVLVGMSLCFAGSIQAQTDRLKNMVARMTLEEKAQLVVGMGMRLPGGNDGPTVGLTQDKVPGAAGTTFAIDRFNIPAMVMADGPAGVRIQPTRPGDTHTYYCTAFPVGTLLASTWDTGLVNKVGQAMGSEVKAYGIDILLAPALNIHRNPLGGRNFEYFSEDPVVSGHIAAAMVNGIESNGVGTSIKHFAANNQETNRNLVNTLVSERALREIYLKGFEIAVKQSQPWTVMSSYNKINGTYTSQWPALLNTVLREEWGFRGFVMSDWFGGVDPVEQMKAGNDLLMPGTPDQKEKIIAAVKSGMLAEKVLDINVLHILNILVKSPAYQRYTFDNQPNLQAHAAIARQAAAEGIVLLKNDNHVLPLAEGIKTFAGFGNTTYQFISGGTGSGDVNEAYTVSLPEGLAKAGYIIDEGLKIMYTAHIAAETAKQPAKKFFFELPAPLPEPQLDDVLLQSKASGTDIALITIGRNSGEFQDRKKENDFYLTRAEKDLLQRVSTAFHAKGKKVVVILNVGGVIETASWEKYADAIVLAWQGGQESGNAVADILSGRVNPSGKLTTTFPVKYEDVSSANNFPGRNLSDKEVKSSMGFSLGYDSEVMYGEGIYVGYRYYSSFGVRPAYPFGYGLSYTNFTYSSLTLDAPVFRGKITASVTVKNTGNKAGSEVVQLYVSAPAPAIQKPAIELKGFAKTRVLQPGETVTLRFTLTAKDLASFYTKERAWIADAGQYTIKTGASSADIRQTATFKLANKIITEKSKVVLEPLNSITEMSAVQ